MLPRKPRSAKLPLLIALPVLLALGVAAVFLIPTDPAPRPIPPTPGFANDDPGPTGNGTDPLIADPNPRPRPNPRPSAPSDVAVAEAIEDEADAAMDAVRSRLELKFKHAEYKLDRTWTLEQVMRRLDALSGTHFTAADFALSFPDGTDPIAVITCATIQGHEMPDGPLKMTVDLRTGKSTREGRVLARNADGYVLLGDAEYRLVSEVLREAVQAHVILQADTDSGLASLETPFQVPQNAVFAATDFTANPVKGEPLSAAFACHTLRGEPLAEPAVVTINYKTRTATLSAAKSPGWMELPGDRDQLMRRTRWMLREVASRALEKVAEGVPAAELTAEKAHNEAWIWSHAVVLPFDVTLKFDKEQPQRMILEIATCFGRQLPYPAVRYVADSSTGTFAFEE
jgi:hypothetical protein